ncbi:unnamed protein product [Cylindrotheca closterium]|uniref:Uncharacterized protein n=1 Tax=Cylindrotheca closterium TaxID=2856 RepID=A0AAD2FQM1_9STRA|nr:unnamed protein product [Cylindrotheca closterium]
MADEANQSKEEAAASDIDSNKSEEEEADDKELNASNSNKFDNIPKAPTRQNSERDAKDRARLSHQPAIAPGAVLVRDGGNTDRESRKMERHSTSTNKTKDDNKQQPGAVQVSATSSRQTGSKSVAVAPGSVMERGQSEDPRIARKSAQASTASSGRSSVSTNGRSSVTESSTDDSRVQRKIMRNSVTPSVAGSVTSTASDDLRVTRKTARGSVQPSAAPPLPTPYEEVGMREMSGGSASRNREQASDRQLHRELSAQLVTDEHTLVSEEQKQRVRREAEAEVQQQFISGAVIGEATIIEDDDEEANLRTRRRQCIVFLTLSFLILVIVLSVVLTRSGDDAPIVPINNICRDAFGPVTNFTGGSIEGVILAFEETDVVGCQIEADDGFGLWYYLEGNGERISASTCDTSNLDPQMDTQVLVFEGSCDNLICIGGGDQLCDNHGAVGWLAEEGKRYFVLVRGFRASLGRFSLSIDKLTNHENCKAADAIETADSPVFGSTRNQSLDESSTTCDGNSSISPASWYQIEGDGAYKCARASTDDPVSVEYAVQLSVYSGICSDLSCVSSSSKSDDPWSGRTEDVVWRADLGADYHLALNGVKPDSTGDFLLEIVTTPSNVVCEESVPIRIDGTEVFGTTANSCRVVPIQCPKIIGSGDSSGIWYVVGRAGSNLVSTSVEFDVETTCVSGRGAKAQVSVFASKSNGCDDLECVDFTEFCDAESKATISQWLSDANVEYYLFVQTSEPSDFRLQISETILEGPDTCGRAIPIPVGGSVLGSTLNATSGDLTQCGDVASVISSPSVFFTVDGTGRNLTASTCNHGTNYLSGVSILTGSCESLTCVDYTSVSCDGVRSLSYWPSVLGETYYVVVHGSEADDAAGRFNLTIEEGGIEVENDFCTTAQIVSFPSLVNGTTVGARFDGSSQCDIGEGTRQSPGVWYSGMVQEDSLLIASLCNQGTSNFDTVLQVFSGSCDSLNCIASNDDYEQVCGRRSLVSWNATAGELYHILVTGFAENDVGDIQLQLAISDDLQLQILD